MATPTPSTIQRAARSPLAALRNTAQTLAVEVRSAHADIALTNVDPDLTDQAKFTRNAERRVELQAAVDNVEATGLAALEEIQKLPAQAQESGTDPAVALLHESQLTRCWKRVKSLLDSGHEAHHIAQRALEEGDRLVFEAFAQELPSWLRSKGHEEQSVEVEAEAVAAIGEPLRNEAEQAAATAEEDGERLFAWLRTNVGLVRLDNETTDLLLAEDADGTQTTIDLTPAA